MKIYVRDLIGWEGSEDIVTLSPESLAFASREEVRGPRIPRIAEDVGTDRFGAAYRARVMAKIVRPSGPQPVAEEVKIEEKVERPDAWRFARAVGGR